MATQCSFDVTSTIDLQEVDNALNQARKEVAQRYDFKGTKASIEFETKDAKLVLVADDERVAPPGGLAGGGRERFPEAFAGLELQAAKLAVAARAVDEAVFNQGRGHHAVQAVGYDRTVAFVITAAAATAASGTVELGFSYKAA